MLLIVGGVSIGPQVFDWAETGTLSLLSNVGLGFLFLLAGYELELDLFTRQPGYRALAAWFISMGLAVAVTSALAAVGYVEGSPGSTGAHHDRAGDVAADPAWVRHAARGSFGEHILAACAVGEFFRVVGIAVSSGPTGSSSGCCRWRSWPCSVCF